MRLFTLPRLAISILALTIIAGCPSREVAKVDPNPTKEEQKEIPVNLNRDVDLLFVIDNSGSMEGEQQSLRDNFPEFINVLNKIEGGLPNIRIGVITTDMGGGPGGCSGRGDNGALQTGVGCGINGGDPWLQDYDDGAGGRTRNYTGNLEDAFSCIADVGTNGCGFEMHLKSMENAITNAANGNFIRDNAFLAVIFITDEDDCSIADGSEAAMLDTNPALDNLQSDVGPLHSFRCFEFGVTCESPSDARVLGQHNNCLPNDTSPYMNTVQSYVDTLKEAKADPRLVIVAGIIGIPEQEETPDGFEDIVNVNLFDRTADNRPEARSLGAAQGLTPGTECQRNGPDDIDGFAFPGIRLKSFLQGFPQRSTTTNICNDDLTAALNQIAELLRKLVANPCLEGCIADIDPTRDGVQPDCSVYDETPDGNGGVFQSPPFPMCDIEGDPDNSTNKPCWTWELDDVQCSTETQPSSVKILIGRNDDSGDVGTFAQIRCLSDNSCQ